MVFGVAISRAVSIDSNVELINFMISLFRNLLFGIGLGSNLFMEIVSYDVIYAIKRIIY